MRLNPVETQEEIVDRKVQDALAEEVEWKDLEDEEMIRALKEALICKRCRIDIKANTMIGDIKRGAYTATEYPPYFATNRARDDMISPLDIETRNQDSPFWKRVPTVLCKLYLQQVEHNLLQILAKEHKPKNPDLALLLAHYQLDYHIHQHFLSRSCAFNLCRDADDMNQLREWQWEMAEVDGLVGDMYFPWDKEYKEWEIPSEGWLNDENKTMEHQAFMWGNAWMGRRDHLKQVRARWAVIMEERRKQREMLLLKEKQKRVVTLRVYCRGELWGIRSIEWTDELGPWPKRRRTSDDL